MKSLEKQEAAAGLHPDDGQTTHTQMKEQIVSNRIITQTTDIRDAESIARADQYGSETITLAGFNPDGYIDKNESGIWHVIIREEPTHRIPEKRVVLDACPRDYWSGLNVKKHAELTTRGFSWVGDDDCGPREFRFTYVDRYELVDRLISIKTGEWTCVFRRLTKAA